jgi:hypothetical protein
VPPERAARRGRRRSGDPCGVAASRKSLIHLIFHDERATLQKRGHSDGWNGASVNKQSHREKFIS